MAKRNIKEKKDKEECDCGCNDKCNCKCCRRARFHKRGGGFFYFLGFIGSAIYFVSHTNGFWNIVLAILKALVWPVFLMLKILGL
jgi:hypothetical protein